MKRFLVTHDYGMGSLWWWIEAPSAEAIIQTYAEVMIVEPADGETEIRGYSVASHWRSCACWA